MAQVSIFSDLHRKIVGKFDSFHLFLFVRLCCKFIPPLEKVIVLSNLTKITLCHQATRCTVFIQILFIQIYGSFIFFHSYSNETNFHHKVAGLRSVLRDISIFEQYLKLMTWNSVRLVELSQVPLQRANRRGTWPKEKTFAFCFLL